MTKHASVTDFFAVDVDRGALVKALGHVQRIVEKRNTIPILAHALIEASAEGMQITATDLDMYATATLPAATLKAESITVPAHILFDIARKLSDGAQVALRMEGDSGQMILRSGRSRFALNTLPASDFPDLTKADFTHTFTMKGSEIVKMFGDARFAISSDDTRYYLQGVYLHAQETGNALALRAVATDGHRLARIEMLGPVGIYGMLPTIVPRKAVGEILRLAEGAEAEPVKVSLSSVKMRFDFGRVILTTKLIDGTFPDYQRVIPTGNNNRLTVDREALIACVERVALLSGDKRRAIKLDVSEGNLTLSVVNLDAGSAEDSISVEYDGAPMTMGFNHAYLVDILSTLKGDKAVIRLADPESPALIFDPKSDESLFVLMPLRA